MSRPQPYYAQPSSSAPTEDDAASEYSCSSYSTDRPTAAQPPAQQLRALRLGDVKQPAIELGRDASVQEVSEKLLVEHQPGDQA